MSRSRLPVWHLTSPPRACWIGATVAATVAPLLQAHAAGALINFLHGAFDQLVEPYVDALLADLYTLLSNGPVRVQVRR